jgi:hypothetical protein
MSDGGGWVALYTAAMAESDLRKLNGRIEAARQSIHKRLDEIEGEDFHDARERQQLGSALYALETLVARKRSA